MSAEITEKYYDSSLVEPIKNEAPPPENLEEGEFVVGVSLLDSERPFGVSKFSLKPRADTTLDLMRRFGKKSV